MVLSKMKSSQETMTHMLFVSVASLTTAYDEVYVTSSTHHLFV